MIARIRRRLQRTGGDRGSMALFVIVFGVAVLGLSALLIDVGTAISVRERAADATEQAARAAAENVSLTGLRSSGVAVINNGTGGVGDPACASARQLITDYAQNNHLSLTLVGCKYFPAGEPTKVTVSATVTSKAIFLPSTTFKMPVSESACAMTTEETC